MHCKIALILFLLISFRISAQPGKTKNVILVTLDGFRVEEFFGGVDPEIVNAGKWASMEEVSAFWHADEPERRKLLLPFIWTELAGQGQLYGNRAYHNKVNCANHHLLSYPGYSEMLVGFPHRKVSSNKAIENPHPTVLEVISRYPGFRDEVAAFATWKTFDFILREKTSDLYVNAGQEPARGDISRREHVLNEYQHETGVRSDSLTWQFAMEYLKRERPRVLMIGFDETDHYAHRGKYGEYLKAANRADRMIGQLWKWIQSQPDYRDQTTLIISTDHGRGNGRNNWRTHKLLAAGSRHIWLAVMGPDTPPFGEMKIRSTIYQKQLAKTIAAFLGVPYQNSSQQPGEVIQTVIAVPENIEEPLSASAN